MPRLAAGAKNGLRWAEEGRQEIAVARPGWCYAVGACDVGAAPGQARAEMAAPLAEVPKAPAGNALTVAAHFHATFENTHPFTGGNGRCSR